MSDEAAPVVRARAQEEQERERKGAGAWLGAGSRPSSLPPGFTLTGAAPLGPASGLGPATGVFGALLGLRGGTAAVLFLATAAMVASLWLLAAHFFGGTPPRVLEASAGPWDLFPARERAAAPIDPALASYGTPTSLDYMKQAVENDAWLREIDGKMEQEALADAAGADGSVPAGPGAGAPSAPGTADAAGAAAAKPLLAKLPPLAGRSGGLSAGGAAGLRDAPNSRPLGPAQRVFGTAKLSRNMASAMDGRRRMTGLRGRRTSDMLRFANRDGLGQRSARNPTMTAAGYTFDGAGANRIQASEAGRVGAGGIGSPPVGNGRFSPDRVVDQKEVPQPAKPVGEKDETPYKDQMMMAVGALLASMLLMKLAGMMKDKGQHKVAMFLHLLAALFAGLAAAVGAQIMQDHDQRAQGMIFIAGGGILALYNLKAAYDVSKGSGAAQQTETDVVAGADKAIANEHVTLTQPAQ